MPFAASALKPCRRACAALLVTALALVVVGSAIARGLQDERAQQQAETINALLRIHAGPNFSDWDAYRAVLGVDWDAPRTIGKPAERAIATGMDQFGAIRVMTGVFGRSRAQADAAVRVTTVALGGRPDAVETLAIRESRPRRSGAADVIADSLGADGGVRGIAFDCARNASGQGPDRLRTSFYSVDGGFARPLYLEITVEFGAARTGETVYRFYRQQPVARIVTMRCKRRAQP